MSIIASANPDSRRAPRVPLLRDVDCIGSGPRGRGRLADLSVGGAFLELLPPPPVGALLTLRFRPLDSEPPLLVRAEVVYVQAGLGAGCRFVAPEDAVRARLEQLVQNHLAAPRREEMRRSGRVMVDIAVTLSGRDAGDVAFEETGVLVTLSRNGAALSLGHRPRVGAPLLVRWAGREFRGTVVWVGNGAQQGQVRVGIQNRGLARAFGFEFPAPSSSGEPPPLAVERAGAGDLPAALALLRQAQLPEDGVADGFRDYVVVRDGVRLAGLCGLETYGAHGLLRSLVVSPEHRGGGLGESLVDEIVTRAAARGLKDVYLLTATARDFFLRQGFVELPREQAPDAIRQSWEFRAGCPRTAAFMRRPLASAH